LAQAGIPAAVMVAPVIPDVTDHEMETILTRAHVLGACEAGYILLRLPLETQDIFSNWLLENYPDKYRKVMALLRDRSVLVTPAKAVTVCRHDPDNRFVECAEAAGAEFLVTGNKRHFPQHWKTTRVVNAREILALIGTSFLQQT